MRVAVVGPTHPFKGGVAAHTTELAHRLSSAGHDVDLVSWSSLYPRLLYPGEQQVPAGAPDVPVFPRTRRRLSWARPYSWLREGRRLNKDRAAEPLEPVGRALGHDLDRTGMVAHPTVNAVALRHAIDKRTKSDPLNAAA